MSEVSEDIALQSREILQTFASVKYSTFEIILFTRHKDSVSFNLLRDKYFRKTRAINWRYAKRLKVDPKLPGISGILSPQRTQI